MSGENGDATDRMIGYASTMMTLDDLDRVAAALDLAAQRHLVTRDLNPTLPTNPTHVVGLGS